MARPEAARTPSHERHLGEDEVQQARSELQPMTRNQRIGRWGEDAAASYLSEAGYTILSRNLRTPYGEVDLLAQIEDEVVFVEVKTRTTSALGPPEIAVDSRKQAHILACAEHYAQQTDLKHWRIDVIAVERIHGQARITHFENAIS